MKSINSVYINRILITMSLFSAVFVLAFFLWLNYASHGTDALGIKPLVYEKKLPPEIGPQFAVNFSNTNIFDVTGAQWTIPEKKGSVKKNIKKTLSIPERKDIQGILILPTVSGVFTKEGFVPTGNKLMGASIKRVENDKIIFSTAEGEKTLNLKVEQQGLKMFGKEININHKQN